MGPAIRVKAYMLFLTWPDVSGRKVSKIQRANRHNLCVPVYGDAGAGSLPPGMRVCRGGSFTSSLAPRVFVPQLGVSRAGLPGQEGAPRGHALGTRRISPRLGHLRREHLCEDSVAHAQI